MVGLQDIGMQVALDGLVVLAQVLVAVAQLGCQLGIVGLLEEGVGVCGLFVVVLLQEVVGQRFDQCALLGPRYQLVAEAQLLRMLEGVSQSLAQGREVVEAVEVLDVELEDAFRRERLLL